VLRHHDPDQVGQLSMSLSDEPASDLVIHECQQCQTVTVAKVLSLASLGAPMALSPAGKSDDEPERTQGRSPNGNEPHHTDGLQCTG
jgi:hypothetical protein